VSRLIFRNVTTMWKEWSHWRNMYEKRILALITNLNNRLSSLGMDMAEPSKKHLILMWKSLGILIYLF